MAAERLSPAARAEAMATLAHWREVPGREAMTRRFVFADFSAAFAFMAEVALVAERMDHHPEWFNVFNRIDVTLATHDAGGITTLDVSLATRMEVIAAKHGAGA